ELVRRAAPVHPHPLARGRIERPKIVEKAGATKEPKMPAVVNPAHSLIAASGNVFGSGRSFRAVHSGPATRADRATSADPHPLAIFANRTIELPQVIQIAAIADAIYAQAPKEPEIAAAVGPGRSPVAASGDVSGSGRSLRA